MHFLNFANGAVLHPLNDTEYILRGMALEAGLRGLMRIFLRGLHHGAYFIDIVGKRFFAIDVLAALHGRQCCDGMGVVGSGDDNRVDLLVQLVEHDAPVVIAFHVRVFLNRGGGHIVGARAELGGRAPIHVAEADDVLARQHSDVGPSGDADADERDVELVARRQCTGAS